MGNNGQQHEMRVRGRHWRWDLITISALVLALAACTVGCGTAASDPPTAVTRNETVVLLPALSAGDAGWCLLALPSAEEGEDGCPTTRTGYPIIAETWDTSASAPETRGLDVVSSDVAAVSFNGGAPLPTKAESVLPDHLRAVAWAIRGQTPAMAGSPFRPTPLDRHERALRQTLYPPSSAIGGHGLRFEVPSHKVEDPVDPSSGPCVIRATRLPALVAKNARVVSTVRAYEGLLGEAFLACAMTEYTLARWPMGASVLVDVAHPGTAPPSLPLMKPVPGHIGVFEEPGQLGSQVSRRIPGGWLVVWGGRTQVQRLTLLDHLRASAPR